MSTQGMTIVRQRIMKKRKIAGQEVYMFTGWHRVYTFNEDGSPYLPHPTMEPPNIDEVYDNSWTAAGSTTGSASEPGFCLFTERRDQLYFMPDIVDDGSLLREFDLGERGLDHTYEG